MNNSASNTYRITPAYTGNTRVWKRRNRACQDHPRIHGEHCASLRSWLMPLGSPPHTRGTLLLGLRRPLLVRITPAYTGNTDGITRCARKVEDHPRIHGEHCYEMGTGKSIIGSPPHTRGTQHGFNFAFFRNRITPAYTGNTRRNASAWLSAWDHPRIHGEHGFA